MESLAPAKFRIHERILLRVDQFPWGPLYRIAIGYWIVPLFLRLVAKDQPGVSLIVWFIGVLLAIRLVPVVLRKMLPLSPELAAAWAERRNLAKRYDSYQWRKLFWFGVGLVVYAVASRQFDGTSVALTAFCLSGGALGYVAWSRQLGFRRNLGSQP